MITLVVKGDNLASGPCLISAVETYSSSEEQGRAEDGANRTKNFKHSCTSSSQTSTFRESARLCSSLFYTRGHVYHYVFTVAVVRLEVHCGQFHFQGKYSCEFRRILTSCSKVKDNQTWVIFFKNSVFAAKF